MKNVGQFAISGLTDGAMREAIGAVCVHWSLLELMVERVIANIEGTPGIVTYTDDLARRLDYLKKAAKQKLPPEKHQRISEIAGFIKKVKEERHRVVHGLWGLDEWGLPFSLFPRDATGNVTRPMPKDEIRRIKLQIWQAYRELEPFADLSKSVVLSLPHKRGKQAPPRPVLRPSPHSKKDKP